MRLKRTRKHTTTRANFEMSSQSGIWCTGRKGAAASVWNATALYTVEQSARLRRNL